ncbi:MAG: IPExxxVDY family protein [Bacteroidetes bacterium]|nr:IPExxxVDY family protein [Bacteroidota bacterium]MBK6818485.1 IPExxxVDY family protein [Bacteroidota bacterium]HQW46314.1 IPExxxVDY family protein [Chitinophagaceae bacterium]
MKISKPKNQVLDNSDLEDEFFEDVRLIGIVSASEYYQLISYINQRLAFSFVRNHELEIQIQQHFFPVFEYKDEEKLIEHYIFCNRRKTNYMMPDAKNIDFIWLLKGNFQYQEKIQQLPVFLKKVEGIDFCFDIVSDSLKMRQLLII